MKKLFLFLTVAGFFMSCQKYPDDVTVTINESGYIKVNVVDNDNKAIEGATVQIYYYWGNSIYYERVLTNAYVYYGNTVFEGITDASGMCVPEKMLQGSYYCTVSFTKREIVYQEQKEIQVMAGETRTVSINPFANSGNVNIQLVSPDERPIPELNVLILPRDYYSNSIDECIAAANFKGKIDSQKKINFVEIPTGYYQAWIYDDNKKIYRTYNSESYINIERGKTKDHSIRVDLNL